MNKGKVRDNEQLKYKLQLVQKLLELDGKHKKSEFAKSLLRKGSGALKRMLDNRERQG